jgi:L-ribulose-5-phosphate 4-epimerase
MLEDLKRQCLEANLALPRLGLIHMTFGNVSVIDRGAGIFAIKPSGVSYDTMTADDMVLVDLKGKTVGGVLRPSSDTPTHLRLYQQYDVIGAIVHTHSTHATAFAQAGRPVPCFGTTHADFFRGEVPVTRPLTQEEIDGDYETETGNVIIERLRDLDPAAMPAILAYGHGPFAWGPTAAKAVENAHALELVAQMALATLALNPDCPQLPAYHVDKHFLRKHGKNAYYGQKELK